MSSEYMPRIVGRAARYALAWLMTAVSCSFAAELHKGPGLEVQLVSNSATVTPGSSFHAGLYFRLDEGWHIYWLNAGDSGEPPKIIWDLPADVKAGPILWPVPKRIEVEPFVNYGYEDEVLLPIPIQLSTTFSDARLLLSAEVRWLVCKEECLPGQAKLALPIPVRPGQPLPDADWQRFFAATFEMLPRQSPAHWRLSGSLGAESFQLAVRGNTSPVKAASFMPFAGDYIEHAAAQAVKLSGSSVELELQRSSRLVEAVTHVAGLLVLTTEAEGIEVYEVDFPLGGLDAGHLIWPLVLAFIGGLLLNLMPCVFPILSLKVMSVLQMSGQQRAHVIRRGWAYTLGILVSFWLLVAVLLTLQHGGQQIGWGFQLQSPPFVFLLASVLFAFGLNLLGLFEISGRFMGYGSALTQRPGYVGSFCTGVLATLMATPCTAPFMGSAIGFALGQSLGVVFGIFTALAVGLALPYLLIAHIPAVGRWLPRPGRWMETFKQSMAFFVFGTVIWLAWVLGLQTSAPGLVTLLLAFFSIGLVVWIANRWRRAAIVAALLGIVAVGFAAASLAGKAPAQSLSVAAGGEAGLTWEPFSPAVVAAYRAQGRPLFIDFTAAWCVSCQVNELLVLRSEEIRRALKARGFALVKADWTNHDPIITQTLASFGRNGVPFYVIYGPGEQSPAVTLPEILSPGIVLRALESTMKPVVMALVLLLSTSLAGAAKIGAPSPTFTGTSSTAQEIALAQYRGQYVVLQWHNKDCPYVQAHYDSGNMQRLQQAWTGKGVIWLTIISSAAGKQGYVDANGAEADVRKTGAAPTATILDPTGTIGRAYRAQTTPHMFIIDPEGKLIYNGAIDNRATTSKANVGGSINYVSTALAESMAGTPLSHPTSRPYGCSVKY